MPDRDEFGDWTGCGIGLGFLLTRCVRGTEADARAWVAAQRTLPGCVGGRVAVLRSQGLVDVWQCEALFLDLRETRRERFWLAAEQFPSFGLEWGRSGYVEACHVSENRVDTPEAEGTQAAPGADAAAGGGPGRRWPRDLGAVGDRLAGRQQNSSEAH